MSWPSSCAGQPHVKAVETACHCSVTSFEMPWDVTSVPSYAFANCKALKTINGLEEVTSFGKGVFDRKSHYRYDHPDGSDDIGLVVIFNLEGHRKSQCSFRRL